MSRVVDEKTRRAVRDRGYFVCEYCLIHEDDTFWGCEVDHVISRKHGGGSSLDNLAWACATCNNHKGSDIATLVGDPPKLTRFFHPRDDRWADCFELHSCRIEPLNDIATGTARILQLNESSRVRERDELARVGRYPTVEALARMKE